MPLEALAFTTATLPTGMLTLAEGFMLVSVWKPILLLIPFIPWAMIVSRVLDKHAARFFLARQGWNTAHLSVGLIALIVAISIPAKEEWSFWLGWGLMILILVADIVVFAMVTNKDERVPAEHQLTLDFSRWTSAREAKAAAKKQGKVELLIKAPDKSVLAPPDAQTPEFETRVAAERLMVRTLDSRSTEMTLAPTGRDNMYASSQLIDGVRQAGDVMPAADAARLMNFWKTAAKLDIAEQRKRQQAEVGIERGDARKKVRITTIGSQTGPRMTFLIDPDAQVRRKKAQLGLLEPQVKELDTIVTEAHGLVLLAGGPDSGRTTTLYSVVKMHDAYTKNVQTIELDVQDAIEGARQNKWDAQTDGPEFSTLVRSIIRRDPDVVGVAELPDQATAKELAKAEVDRTRVYVSVKADNALGAIQLWLKAVGDADTGSKVLHGVMAQKLLRKLCVNCRVAYQPSADMVKKMGLPPDKIKQLFKKGGQVLIKNKPEVCPVCGGGGYIGQEGVFEIFALGDAERGMIKAGDWNALKGEFRKKGLPTIQQSALRKAIDGITSVEEVMRITADPAKAAESGTRGAEPKPPAATPDSAKA